MFFSLPQLGHFLDASRSCNTPGCRGNLTPICVKSKGLGGGISVSICCTGCAMQGAMFHTLISAFIVAGCTHEVDYQILKNALGIDAFSEPVFMDTIL